MSVAVVTGGSRGIGAAIVEELASSGMSVACTATSLERAAPLAKEVHDRYLSPVLPFGMRVEDPAEVSDCFASIQERLGPISLVVNNAGITNVAPILEADLDILSKVVDVNLKGV